MTLAHAPAHALSYAHAVSLCLTHARSHVTHAVPCPLPPRTTVPIAPCAAHARLPPPPASGKWRRRRDAVRKRGRAVPRAAPLCGREDGAAVISWASPGPAGGEVSGCAEPVGCGDAAEVGAACAVPRGLFGAWAAALVSVLLARALCAVPGCRGCGRAGPLRECERGARVSAAPLFAIGSVAGCFHPPPAEFPVLEAREVMMRHFLKTVRVEPDGNCLCVLWGKR